MKKIIMLALALATPLLDGCGKADTKSIEITGRWHRRSQFEGLARSGAVSFVIAGKAYVALGTDGTDRYRDLWEFMPATGTWRQRADFPGQGRFYAVAFAANGKGYVGTGYNGTDRLADFYEFDPTANQWRRRADFAGSARYAAVAFALAGKGYVATGYDGNYKKDLWQYDPATDAWSQKPSFGGSKRLGAVGFVAAGQGYVATGLDNGIYQTDVWSYNPATETWTERRKFEGTAANGEGNDFSALPRAYAVAFGGADATTAYVALGATDAGPRADCYAYSATADAWTKKTDFAGTARTGAVGFEADGLSFIGLGTNSNQRFDDVWELRAEEK